MGMEALVDHLAYLQDELKAEIDASDADGIVITLREVVADAEKQLEAAKIALSNELIYTDVAIERVNTEIEATKAQIIEAWDNEKKTIKYDVGTLKFRTTTSLNIRNEVALLYNLIDHTCIEDVATKYVAGFNKTAVKKYMGVHELPTVIAELISKTTVKLEAEG